MMEDKSRYVVCSSLPGGYKRCRLSWLTKSGGREGIAGPQPMRTAVHKSPNKLWRSNSIFNLCNRNHTDSNVPHIKQRVKYRPISFRPCNYVDGQRICK